MGVGRAFWLRLLAVAVFDALAVVVATSFAASGTWGLLALMVFAIALVNVAYLTPRFEAARWLTPGLILMAFFVVFPVFYTSYVSLTNWRTGNVLTKDQAIVQIERREVQSDGISETGDLAVYRDQNEQLALVVVVADEDATLVYAGLVTEGSGDEAGDGGEAFSVPDGFDVSEPPASIGGFELLTRLALTGEASRLEGATITLPDGRTAAVETLSSYRLVTGGKRFAYDAASDTLYDTQADRTCASGQGAFICNDVPQAEVSAAVQASQDAAVTCSGGRCNNVPLYGLDASLPGWRAVVGGDNYVDLFTERRIRAPFLRVLAWNVVFAVSSVLMTFGLGLGLAMLVQDEGMRGRNVYRSIYIIPYAVPGFLSILIWRGLLNTEFGKVNGMLEAFGIPGVNWLGGNTQAMVSVLLVNLWLGFPYMFLISSGALTSIPTELLEAARVDGASAWKSFRMITLPLLLVSTAPLLIGSFAFNFNNFILTFLLTSGGPPLTGYDVPVGATDLLISFTFKLAQASGRGQQYGLSSAIVVVIFLVLATSAALSFRLTKKLEEVYDQ